MEDGGWQWFSLDGGRGMIKARILDTESSEIYQDLGAGILLPISPDLRESKPLFNSIPSNKVKLYSLDETPVNTGDNQQKLSNIPLYSSEYSSQNKEFCTITNTGINAVVPPGPRQNPPSSPTHNSIDSNNVLESVLRLKNTINVNEFDIHELPSTADMLIFENRNKPRVAHQSRQFLMENRVSETVPSITLKDEKNEPVINIINSKRVTFAEPLAPSKTKADLFKKTLGIQNLDITRFETPNKSDITHNSSGLKLDDRISVSPVSDQILVHKKNHRENKLHDIEDPSQIIIRRQAKESLFKRRITRQMTEYHDSNHENDQEISQNLGQIKLE